jgi:predicted methyltransferase
MKYGLALLLALCTLGARADFDWQAALEGEHRSAENQARDVYRHPRQTLEFFGLKPGMTVLEVSPGGGWYSEVLAPLMKENGEYYAAHGSLNPPNPYYRRSLGGYLLKLGENDEIYGDVIVTQLQPPEEMEAAPAGSVDLAVAFRNVHSWMRGDVLTDTLSAIYTALKPGGHFGVVQHRARPDTPEEAMKESGYVTEDYVIKAAEAAGFKLAERSEINANPKDTADHPKGVWNLPPSLRDGDEDRERYLGIGESDRMTLLFVKPEA